MIIKNTDKLKVYSKKNRRDKLKKKNKKSLLYKLQLLLEVMKLKEKIYPPSSKIRCLYLKRNCLKLSSSENSSNNWEKSQDGRIITKVSPSSVKTSS